MGISFTYKYLKTGDSLCTYFKKYEGSIKYKQMNDSTFVQKIEVSYGN